MAHVLGTQANRIVVRVKRLGGGFGGKESRTSLVALPVAFAAHRYCHKEASALLKNCSQKIRKVIDFNYMQLCTCIRSTNLFKAPNSLLGLIDTNYLKKSRTILVFND